MARRAPTGSRYRAPARYRRRRSAFHPRTPPRPGAPSRMLKTAVTYDFRGLSYDAEVKQINAMRKLINRWELLGRKLSLQVIWYGVPVYSEEPQSFSFSMADPTGQVATPQAFHGWRGAGLGFVDILQAQYRLLLTHGARDIKVEYIILRYETER